MIEPIPISPPPVDSSKGPHRVNRAHWPTMEIDIALAFFVFSGPWKKWPQMAPNRARRIFLLLIQTLPPFWAERILILILFVCWGIFLDPNFLDFQVSKFPDFQVPRSPNSQIPDPGVAGAAAGRILRSENLYFLFFGPQISGFPGPQISKFLDFQVPRSPNSQISNFPDFQVPRSPSSQISSGRRRRRRRRTNSQIPT